MAIGCQRGVGGRRRSEAPRGQVPAVIFWAAEKYTGAVQPFPVYSHELSEIFVCECVMRE